MYKHNTDDLRLTPEWDVCYIGDPSDERGKKAIELCKQHSARVTTAFYRITEQDIIIDGKVVQCHELKEFIEDNLPSRVLFESTTLGVPELALLLNAYVQVPGAIGRICYLEPGKYSLKNEESASSREFELSKLLTGYEGIPTLTKELEETRHRVVFFVGFESNRLVRAFEDQPISPMHSDLVFGVPPYRAGWEANSYHNNIRCLSENDLRKRLHYCAADNPQAVLDKLGQIQDGVEPGRQLFVAPIGSKPHGIGAMLYQALHSESVGLLYDHPIKKAGRSEGYGPFHMFDFSI